MPNGSHFQRGGYLGECRVNKARFILSDGFGHYGGIIVFPSPLQDNGMDENTLAKDIEQRFISFTQGLWIYRLKSLLTSLFNRERESSYPMRCRMGHLFTGEYVSETGERYGISSFCVELNGLGRRQLFSFAKYLALWFGLSNVLVRESGRKRIYLVNS